MNPDIIKLLQVIAESGEQQPTLRDRFAMAALPALVETETWETVETCAAEIARVTFALADAILKERQK